MNNVVMKGKDTIAAKLAECFITIGTRRYNFMQMIDMEAKVDKTKAAVPRLGAIMTGHKSCGMEGTFRGTAHYNQSVMRQALIDYKNTGVDAYFEMQITNDDPGSAAILTAVFWQSLMLTVNTLMKKLKVLLRTSLCRKHLQTLPDSLRTNKFPVCGLYIGSYTGFLP